MSYTLIPNFTDSAETQNKTLSRANMSWATDFRVKNENTDQAILVNLTSPKDRAETVKTGYNEIANVYTNTGIDPSAYAPSVKGGRVLVQVNDVYSYTDTTDAAKPRYDLPVSAQIVLKFPNFDVIDEQILLKTIGRAVGALFDTNADNTTRLKALCRGALVPSGL